MTIPLRRSSGRVARRGVRGALLVAMVGTAACRTVTGFAVEQAAEALTGQEVEIYDRGDEYDVFVDGRRVQPPRNNVSSVYVYGPVRGWERGLRTTASASSSPYFRHRFSEDGCLTFDLGMGGHLFGGAPLDPFGPLVRSGGVGLMPGNTLNIEGDYVPFGRVPLGGSGPAARPWSKLSMFGMAGGPCAFIGIPLFSIGPRTDDPVLHR